jgi:hypothetical protein
MVGCTINSILITKLRLHHVSLRSYASFLTIHHPDWKTQRPSRQYCYKCKSLNGGNTFWLVFCCEDVETSPVAGIVMQLIARA